MADLTSKPRYNDSESWQERLPDPVNAADVLPRAEDRWWELPGPVACCHSSSTGVDQAPDGPDKVWRCDACGWLHRAVLGADGITRNEPHWQPADEETTDD